MPRAKRIPDRLLHPRHQQRTKLASRPHEQEQHHRLIGIARPSLADADRVADLGGELRV